MTVIMKVDLVGPKRPKAPVPMRPLRARTILANRTYHYARWNTWVGRTDSRCRRGTLMT